MKQPRNKRCMVRRAAELPSVLLLLAFLLPVRTGAEALDVFEGARISARSRAMGTAFIPLSDDASSLFINPAGLVLARGITLYAEYGDGEGMAACARGVLVWPGEKLTLAGGYYRGGPAEGLEGEILSLGAAFVILEGAQGSFISAGAGLKGMRYSSGDDEGICLPCGGSTGTDDALSTDLGVMLRPLPMISLAYQALDIFEPSTGTEDGEIVVDRRQAWGLAWIWSGALTVCWERTLEGDDRSDSFGFALRSDAGLELMAGFDGGKVSGGLRWMRERFDCLVSFSPTDTGEIYTSISAQLYFRKKPEEISQ